MLAGIVPCMEAVESPVRAERRRMSRVDTAWLRMDSDANRMMIVGVWVLKPAVARAALVERVREKLLRYERFRMHVVRDATGAAHWRAEAGALDLAPHVVEERLRRRRGESARQALQRRVGVLAATPLDPVRPLWQLHLVQGYEGGSALVARVHHCIGDGIALISVMLSITDGGGDPPIRPRRARPDDAERDWLDDAVLKPLAGLTGKAAGVLEASLARSLDLLADPASGVAGALDRARFGAQAMGDVAALALMPDDSPTRLKGRPSGEKAVAWGEPIPLDRVKAIGKALGCSVNDVLLAAVAGAIGGWLDAHGDGTEGVELRAMVPVNLRPLADAWKLGNRFGLAPLVLPVGVADPVARVRAVHARMAALKTSTQPLLAFAVLAVAGQLPQVAQDAILGLFSKKATAVMTNVPGPAAKLAFCGSTLEQTMFWVPASGDIGVGVSILSYGGGVQFGLVTDRALCDDPQAIVDRFEPEFEKILLSTLLLPWGTE
jgi:diacylglycerol O-acyltransferase